MVAVTAGVVLMVVSAAALGGLRGGTGTVRGGFRGGTGAFRGGVYGGFGLGLYSCGSDLGWPYDYALPCGYYPYPGDFYSYPVDGGSYPTGSVAPPGAPVWYYCDDPQGYYPHVTSCARGWQLVPATPPPLPPPPPG